MDSIKMCMSLIQRFFFSNFNIINQSVSPSASWIDFISCNRNTATKMDQTSCYGENTQSKLTERLSEVDLIFVPLSLSSEYSCTQYSKLTWNDVNRRSPPYFSIETWSKTGYWLGVCHGCYHLHGLTQAARNAKWKLPNEKFLLTVGFELRPRHLKITGG